MNGVTHKMPEMPEVETIRRTLADKVVGRRIEAVKINLPRLVKWPSVSEFKEAVTGRKIERLDRRSKYLLFHLEHDLVMVVHLRMTGRLYYVPAGYPHDKFTHIVFDLDNNDAMIYADSRTLGTLYAIHRAELGRIAGLATMGPEPLSPEFTFDYFRMMLKKRQSSIKAVLLNQQVIGGLGNIYVDESLAVAGIAPTRSAASLSEDEANKLYRAINQVIEEGIVHGGTSFRDYRDGVGQTGSHQHYLRVYGRKGQPCQRCGTPIVRTEVGGRGTHFCPNCQR